jgi:hypothetical protein
MIADIQYSTKLQAWSCCLHGCSKGISSWGDHGDASDASIGGATQPYCLIWIGRRWGNQVVIVLLRSIEIDRTLNDQVSSLWQTYPTAAAYTTRKNAYSIPRRVTFVVFHLHSRSPERKQTFTSWKHPAKSLSSDLPHPATHLLCSTCWTFLFIIRWCRKVYGYACRGLHRLIY